MNENELMGQMKISKAVAKMAVPSVISSLVTVVYNMADTFFVGQTGDPLQVAAVSLTNPIFILMMAFANMFGMGGSAVLSMALGAKNEKRARQTSSFVTYASLIVGILFAVILIVFMDPIFISVLNQGTAGAAIATTIGNILASGYYLWYFLKKSKVLSLKWSDFTVRESILTKVCGSGLPTAIFSALMSVSTIVLNQLLVVYGNDPVAAIGIVFKANMFITFLQMGIANGVQPLLGYNYGAGNMKRFRGVEFYTKKCCLVAGIAATALYFLFREQIIRLFISDNEVVSYGVDMLVAYMLSGPVIGFLFVNMNCMQSVGRALPATILSVLRQGILLIPLLYLLRALFGLNGVILGQSVTDYIAVILSFFLWRKIRKLLEKQAAH